MIEYEIKPQNKFSLGLKELWKYRELFYFFTWRDVKVKYKQAALGILWAILQPLVMMLMFTLIFSKALNVSSDGIPYPVFAISGLLIWNIFSNGLINSANSMVTNANIIKKIYFPRLIIPMSAILTALVDFAFALIIYAAILIYYHQEVSMLISISPVKHFNYCYNHFWTWYIPGRVKCKVQGFSIYHSLYDPVFIICQSRIVFF